MPQNIVKTNARYVNVYNELTIDASLSGRPASRSMLVDLSQFWSGVFSLSTEASWKVIMLASDMPVVSMNALSSSTP